MRLAEDQIFHLVHPKPIKWDVVLKYLAAILSVPLVPYVEWFACLESSATDADDKPVFGQGEHRRAALKMINFYRLALNVSSVQTESMGLLPKVATNNSLNASTALLDETVRPLSEVGVKRWMTYWKKIGFLPE